MVAALCQRLGVPHAILTVAWAEKPETAIQERARNARYRLARRLGEGARASRRLPSRTMSMTRPKPSSCGSPGAPGSRDLPECGSIAAAPGGDAASASAAARLAPQRIGAIVRRRWPDARRRSQQCRRAVRTGARAPGAGEADWLDPGRRDQRRQSRRRPMRPCIGRRRRNGGAPSPGAPARIVYAPADAPREIRRRIVRRAIARLATEGGGAQLRGRGLDQLLGSSSRGGKATCAVSCAAAAAMALFEGAGAPGRPAARLSALQLACSPLPKPRIVIGDDALILGEGASGAMEGDERQRKKARQSVDQEPADLGRPAVCAGAVRADDRRRFAHCRRAKPFPYSEFVRQVDDGNVRTVAMASGAHRQFDISGKQESGEDFRTTAPAGSQCRRPPDPKGVAVQVKAEEQVSIWLYMLYNSLPFLLILGISFFVMRQMRRTRARARWASARAARGC